MFIEAPRFPETISYGSQGGPQWSTDVVATQSGAEWRNRNWAHARSSYDVGQMHRSRAETDALIGFFRAVAFGRLNAFRFKDFSDYTFSASPLGVGDGSRTQFQLLKRYSSGAYALDRPLYKPVAGTLAVWLGGVLSVAWTLEATTGVLTFLTPPAAGVAVTASGEFDVPVRFDTDHMALQAVAPEVFSWPSIPLVEVRDIT